MNNWTTLAAVFLAVSVFAAMKPSDRTEDGSPAVVIHDSGCNILLPEGGTGPATRDIRVYTSGPHLRVCHGTVDNPSGRTIHFDYANTGMLCAVNSGATDDWDETISASGQVALRCRLK